MERGILLFCNKNYLFALGTFLINLKKYISYDGVVVYHEDLDIVHQVAIKKIEPRIKFIKYGLDEFVEEFGLDKQKVAEEQFVKYYSVLAVVKFKIFQLLKDYKTVILFDLDMMLLGDMEDLLAENFDIAWKNEATIRGKLHWRGISDDYIKELGMYDIYDKASTPNAGFVVVKRTFDYVKAYDEGVKYLQKYSFRHPVFIDECLFGYIREKMHLNANYVDGKVYNVFPVDICMKSKLVHFLMDYKPWNTQVIQVIFKEWKLNYDQFVAITGIESNDVFDFSDASKCILNEHYSMKWNELFNRYGFIYPDELKLEPDLSSWQLIFSWHGLISYKIETNWNLYQVRCVCWCEKKNIISTAVGEYRNQLRNIATNNSEFVQYLEGSDGFGLLAEWKHLWDVPETFHRLYDLTKKLREMQKVSIAELKTYHGTKIYADVEKSRLVHSKESEGAEVYSCVNNNMIALFIKVSGMNVYLNDIGKDGVISMASQQTFFPCIFNSDSSVSIEVKDGSVLSAEKDGRFVLRCWNREWEHFFVHVIGTWTDVESISPALLKRQG